jgi:hypothetical protein
VNRSVVFLIYDFNRITKGDVSEDVIMF